MADSDTNPSQSRDLNAAAISTHFDYQRFRQQQEQTGPLAKPLSATTTKGLEAFKKRWEKFATCKQPAVNREANACTDIARLRAVNLSRIFAMPGMQTSRRSSSGWSTSRAPAVNTHHKPLLLDNTFGTCSCGASGSVGTSCLLRSVLE